MILRGAFLENAIPGGQNENGLIVRQESNSPVGKPRRQNEIILMRSGDIECRNFCFATASLTEGESHIHLFKLVCRDPECDGLKCNHGCYKAVDKDCQKILDESDMFILHIVFPTPLIFPSGNVSVKVKFLRKYSLGSHQRKQFGQISR